MADVGSTSRSFIVRSLGWFAPASGRVLMESGTIFDGRHRIIVLQQHVRRGFPASVGLSFPSRSASCKTRSCRDDEVPLGPPHGYDRRGLSFAYRNVEQSPQRRNIT